MINVRRDDHASAGDFVANQLGRDLLFARDVLHLLGDGALAGEMHLREVAVAGLGGFGAALSDTLSARFGYACAGKVLHRGASVAIRSVVRTRHESAFLPVKPLIIRVRI